MSKRGFVYLLGNEYMPNVYKVGCTERAPSERAAELGNHTGVPAPFAVLCYIEVEDFQKIERDLHEWMDQFRISRSREFFHHGLKSFVRWMWFHPERLAFCDATLDREEVSGLLHSIRRQYEGFETLFSFALLDNPWAPKESTAPSVQAEVVSASKAPSPDLKLVGNGSPVDDDDDMPF